MHHPWVGALVASLEFFTRVPRPSFIAYRSDHGKLAPALAPLVGWLVGAVATLVYLGAATVLPAAVSAVLAVASSVILTGALHEDGFADVCDALGAMGDRERALAIMKDPRCGAYAVIGLVLLLLLRVSVLAAIAEAVHGAWIPIAMALVGGHAASRLAGLAISSALPYARTTDSRSVDFVHTVRGIPLAVGCIAGVAPSLAFAFAGAPQGLLALAPVALATAWLACTFNRRFGGWTGDCIGCTQQIAEVVFQVAVCALVLAAATP